ncbi:MAG: S8 family serine peptidase [candidate division KSB1 bacterium]|nr:S8 family serine peptidase [candidate division KSB1 bacterium]MDZ7357167.1 S8 family serine peptidase [candidate division KSB1 bacterium]MDZ7398575.1 S8 family serine peptidase [candidate division KSB1 bacterium]
MKKVGIKIIAGFIVLSISILAPRQLFIVPQVVYAQPSVISEQYARNELIIRLKSPLKINLSKSPFLTGVFQLDSLNAIYRLKEIIPLFSRGPINGNPLDRCYLLRFSNGIAASRIRSSYEKLKDVDWVDYNYFYYAEVTTNPPIVMPLEMQTIDLLEKLSPKYSLTIASIDAGVDQTDPHLSEILWHNRLEKADGKDNDGNGLVDDLCGWNFVPREMMVRYGIDWTNQSIDESGHGTSLARMIMQPLLNWTSFRSGGRLTLMALKAGLLTRQGKILVPAAAAAQAIVYAANHGARVICLSWAGEDSSRLLHHAIRYAAKRDVVIISAAGDYFAQAPAYPAAFPEVWSVTATDQYDQKISSGNFGPWIDLAAPAQLFASISATDSIKYWPSPTSIAAAHVTCLAGILLSNEKIITTDSLKKRILWSSDNIYQKNSGYYGQLGAGRINFFRAVNSQFLPNIVVRQIQFDLSGEKDHKSNCLSVPIWFKIKNLSSTAHGISMQLFSRDLQVAIENSNVTLPVLEYNQEFTNELAPMILTMNGDCPHGYKARLVLEISTQEGFRCEKEFTFINRIIQPPSLTIVNRFPPSLQWTGDPEFAGYCLFRKEEHQRSFRPISQFPASDTLFTDVNTNPNQRYWYYISAFDSVAHEITRSNVVFVHPELRSLFQFFPSQDTSILKGASISFAVVPIDSEKYSFQWLLNRKPISNDSNRIAFQSYQFEQKPNDTITVKIRHFDEDTTLIHSWILWPQKSANKIAIVGTFPKSDTTIRIGDRLKCSIQTFSSDVDSLSFRWQVNERIFAPSINPWVLIPSDSLVSGKNVIAVTIIASDTTLRHQWIVDLIVARRLLNDLRFLPQSDTTIAFGDTLILSVLADSVARGKYHWRWLINGKKDNIAVEPSYKFIKGDKSTVLDTIVVEIADQDSSMTHRWIVSTKVRPNRAPQIRYCSPPLDSFIVKSDSIQFQVLCQDPDHDSLRYSWSLNGLIDRSARQHQYVFSCTENRSTVDTLRLSITDADTAIYLQWILWPSPLDSIAESKKIHYLPQDSVVVLSDSLVFLVRHAKNDFRFRWKVNHQIDSSAQDSIFVYHPVFRDSKIDTITVLIEHGDSAIVHRWYIQKAKMLEARPFRLAFYPKEEELSITPPDSLTLSVGVREGDRDVLQYRWSIGQQLMKIGQDSSFCYRVNSAISMSDTVWLVVEGRDTTVMHHWVIHPAKQIQLPAPRLIFPIQGGRIHEEDLFIWENDSLLSQDIDLTKCRYVIQLSWDSTFSKLISTDTCRTKRINLNQLIGFERISIDRPFYWRVKLLTSNGYQSGFRKCNLACSYYPQFAQLDNFFGRINSDATIDLFWIISYETNCAGFHLYRSESPNKDFTRLTDQLITGKEHYSFQDRTAEAGKTYFYKLEQLSLTGKKKFHNVIALTAPKPEKFMLWQNYPNPFNTQTSIKYEIPTDGQVKIMISNVLGRKIKTLVDEFHKAGFYTIYWDGRDDLGESVVSGIYFYSLITPTERLTRKMVIAR